MKFALIKPPDLHPDGRACSVQNYAMPFGILDIQAYLSIYGISSEVMVLSDFEEISTYGNYDVIGISTLTATCHAAYYCARLIKDLNPNCLVIMGGPHCNGFYSQILNAHPSIDAVVVGEGEIPILELARGKPINEIPGIASRKSNGSLNFSFNRRKVDMNDLCHMELNPTDRFMQNFRGKKIGRFLTSDNGFVISSSRGCTGKCTFCSSPYTWGSKTRRPSPALFADRIEKLMHKFAITEFFFADDVFVEDKEWMNDFCGHLDKFAWKPEWSCLGRVDLVNYEILETMAAAGCRFIKYGIESASPTVMASMGKNINLDQVKQAVDATKKAGIEVGCGFMAGFPGETPDDMKDTEEFAKSLCLNAFSYTATMLFPGTPIFNRALREGKATQEEFLHWLPEDPKISLRAASPVCRDCQPIYVPDGFTYESFISECDRHYYAIESSITSNC